MSDSEALAESDAGARRREPRCGPAACQAQPGWHSAAPGPRGATGSRTRPKPRLIRSRRRRPAPGDS
eukprot:759556-Hanusia_phi.AAC.4